MGEMKTRTEMMFPATRKEAERWERDQESERLDDLMCVHVRTDDADDKQSGIHGAGLRMIDDEEVRAPK